MKKIKVLHFPIAASRGGRTIYVLNHWKKIDKEKFQFDFITFSKSLVFADELIAQGANVFYLSCYPSQDREQFIKELDIVLDNGYDIIHIHTSYWSDTIVEERARKKGIRKIIVHSHNTGCGTALNETEQNNTVKLHNQVKQTLTKDMATDYWACSEAAGEWLFDGIVPKSQIQIMKNAVDAFLFSYNVEKRNKLRKEYGLEGKTVIGTVGRLIYQKNPLFLLDIFYEVAREIPEAVLLFVGQGKLEDELKEKAKKYGILTKVVFTGFVNNVHEYYQAMDIFAFPSYFEGFGMALLEAQISGLKCVVSEFLPEEVVVTKNVKKISLSEKKEWVNVLTSLCKGYERVDQTDVIREAGYDINTQIRVMEDYYMAHLE